MSPSFIFLWGGGGGFKRGQGWACLTDKLRALTPLRLNELLRGLFKQPRKRQKCCLSVQKNYPPRLIFFPLFLLGRPAYMRILSKHSKYLIFFCTFVYVL